MRSGSLLSSVSDVATGIGPHRSWDCEEPFFPRRAGSRSGMEEGHQRDYFSPFLSVWHSPRMPAQLDHNANAVSLKFAVTECRKANYESGRARRPTFNSA